MNTSDLAVASSGNVFSPHCPARRVLDLLAEKWILLIVHALSEGSMRTGELRRRVSGISEKMLIQSLRRLESHGLVLRTAHPEVPPRVEYALTDLGLSLSVAVRTLDRWVEENAAGMSPDPTRAATH
jgi:DNA-binding HxlR family transcriptional regulator